MDLFGLQAKISIDISEFERGLDRAKSKFSDFSGSIKNISDNFSKASSGLKDLLSPAVDGFKAVESVGQKTANAVVDGLKGFAAVSAAVGGFGTAAVKSGMQFDATMSKVAATVGWTTDELHNQTSEASQNFEQLRDKALEMGAKTQFSASEAADALTYMAMAGWKTSDMLGGIEGIMNLAAASGEDLATTSDIVTDALTAFGMKAEESGHFADILAKASSNSNTNVGLMGETFKYVASVAGSLGYSAEDTAVAIGLMANTGIKASMAGTSLKNILTNMAKPTDTMAWAMNQLGVSLDDGNGKMYSLGEVMDQLRDGFGTGAMSADDFREKFSELNEGLESGKYTQESYDSTLQNLIVSMYGAESAQKAELAASLAGKEGMAGLLAIVSAAPDDYEKLRDAIYDCNGAAEKMAATMVDNLQGDLTLLGSAFESLQISISDALTPTLREFAQFGQKAMAGLLEGFQGSGVSGFMSALSGIVTEGVTMLAAKAPEFAQVSIDFIGALGEGILNSKDAILDAGESILSSLNDGVWYALENYTGDFIEFAYGILDIIGEGINNIKYFSQYIDSFVPLIADAFLTYHEGLFSIGMEILGAIGKGIIENKEKIQSMASETIANMVTALSENAPSIIEGGIALLEALTGAIIENLPLITATGAQIIGELVAGISTSLPALAVVAGAIIPYIAKIIDVVGSIGKVVSNVVQLVSNGINTIMGIGKALMGGIQALFGLITAHPIIAAITAIIAAVVLLWNNCEAFRNAVTAIWEVIKGAFVSAWEAIKAAWEGAGEFFQGVWEAIQSVFSTVAEVLGGFFQAAAEAVQAAWSAVVDFFSGIWEGIKTLFSVVAEVLGGFFSAAWEAIQSSWSAVSDFFSGVWEAIKSVFEPVAEVLGGFFKAAWEAAQGAWEAAKDFFSGIADGIHSVFESVTQFLSETFRAAWDAVQTAWGVATEFFSNIWNNIKEAGSSAAETVRNALKDAWENIKSAWDGAMDFFKGIFDKIVGVFDGIGDKFLSIGKNIVEGLKNGISNGWSAFISWLGGKIMAIPNFVMGLLGINSPSKVFAGIGENMALGLSEGWADQYSSVRNQIERGMNFGSANIGITAARTAQQSEGESIGSGNTFNFTINSPKALNAYEAAREAKKAAQQIASNYI